MTLHGFGLGLRPPHYEAILNEPRGIDWLEIVTENYLVPGGQPLSYLDRIRETETFAELQLAIERFRHSIAG